MCAGTAQQAIFDAVMVEAVVVDPPVCALQQMCLSRSKA